MADIIIHPKDEAYVKIQCDDSIARELQDFFTFTNPNYQNTRQHRQFKWNGKIKLIHLRKMELYRGLIPYVEVFASNFKYTVEYADPSLTKVRDISVEDVEKFAESLQLTNDNGERIKLKDYQAVYVAQALRNKRMIILSPTGSGKSLIIYMLVRSLEQAMKKDKKKILIVVPTTSLVAQLYNDFAEYSQDNGWNVRQTCAKIFQGQDKHTDSPVFISTWQSLYQLPPEYFHQFGTIIGDEAHLDKAESVKKIITSCINAKYRIGLSGTLDDTKVHKLMLEGLFGLVFKHVSTRELMDRGDLADFHINCVLLKHEPIKFSEYREEIDYLVSNEKRNKYISKLALSLKNNTLVLFLYVERHGVILKEMIEKMNDGSKNIYFVYGGVDVEVRERIRKICEKENNAIIVASFGTWSTGSNIKNLHNVIFASPSKGRIRILQSIGRSLRLHQSKERANLFDISDDLRYNTSDKKNTTLEHFIHRLKIYQDEKFSHKLYKVKI